MYDLNMLLNSVCQNFVKDFCIYVHQRYWPVVLYFCGTLSGFGITVMVASQNEFGNLLCNFLEEFEQDRCQLFSEFLVEFSCEAVWARAFVCWKLSDYSFDFCACDESVKIFLFLPGSILESYTFLRICPFLPSCPFYCHKIAYSSLL